MSDICPGCGKPGRSETDPRLLWHDRCWDIVFWFDWFGVELDSNDRQTLVREILVVESDLDMDDIWTVVFGGDKEVVEGQ